MLRADRLRLEVPGRVLCRDLSLTLEAGQCWAILGRNGSGKSTLLHALSGLARPAGGEVCLDGRPLASLGRHERALRIGALLQEETPVFPGTVQDYVSLGRFPHAERSGHAEAARHALQSVDMSHAARQSLDTLSGGEWQRVRIALLLAQAPDLHFLDEPLQHLDLPHQLAVMRLFRQLARERGKTVVMVLHDIFWASHFCDHAILVHDDGNIVSGATAGLVTRESMESLYRCRLQAIATSDGNYFLPALE